MAEAQINGLVERDIDQAVIALKKGAYLLKYGRRGKPKFCPFQLSNDETVLIWYSRKEAKQLRLSQVKKIVPGQRTTVFRRYPRPEKEYQSFSLLYSDRSLDLICKDKDEAEVWLIGLKSLIARQNSHCRYKIDTNGSAASDSPSTKSRKSSPLVTPLDLVPDDGRKTNFSCETASQNTLGKAFSDIISYTAVSKNVTPTETGFPLDLSPSAYPSNTDERSSTTDAARISLSSAISSSSQGSFHDDLDSLGDVFIWGENIGSGVFGGGNCFSTKADATLPKAMESTVVLDVQNIACGSRHAVLVTRKGEIFSWGEESGGRLGHGTEADVSYPMAIDTLKNTSIELVACGEYHTCAVTVSGVMYTWGTGIPDSNPLGHGSDTSHWIPKRVSGDMERIQVSFVSCGPWHTAVVASTGQLFTFGDGAFGALGHGDRSSTSIPREVKVLKGLRVVRVACGVWHTAAVVELPIKPSTPRASTSSFSGNLFTWGDGDSGRLGHGDKEARLVPEHVLSLSEENIHQVACGHDLTAVVTEDGRVYTMGSTAHGQLGNPLADAKSPTLVGGKLAGSFIEGIACGSYHVAALTAKSDVYTWGKGSSGQLGHGDALDRNRPTQVEFLRGKQVKTVVCGSNTTAAVCLHKWISSSNHSVCSGCHNPFGFRRKRHNCYNCGLVFCKTCSSRKSLKASLAPNMNKLYRVCDDCFLKLKRNVDSGTAARNLGDGSWRTSNKVIDTGRENCGPLLQAQFSRCSADSNRTESQQSRQSDLFFPALSGGFQLGPFYSPRAPILDIFDKKICENLPLDSRTTSRAPSPLPDRRSSWHFSETNLDYEKLMNDNSAKEIAALREQVEYLTSKCQHLEDEVRVKSTQAEEAMERAAEEAAKHKSANEIINSLTAQVNELSARLAGLDPSRPPDSIANKMVSRSVASSETSAPTISSHVVEPNAQLPQRDISPGIMTQVEKSHWVLKAGTGVYLTLFTLPDGSNELKRVRFSRKHFSEQQAEKWWTENELRIHNQYNIKAPE